MKIRFSLRGGLVMMTLLAGFLYWRTRPAALANELVRAVKNKDFQAANALIADDNKKFNLEPYATQRVMNAAVEPQSVASWLRGVCEVRLFVERQDNNGRKYVIVRPVMATAGGLQ
jgi:hypothetical protein